MKETVKRINRELKCKGNIVDFYEDTMELPDGKQVTYDYLHHDGATAIVPVLEDGTILMVKQFRNALDRDTLEIPAGKLDTANESSLICAKRELEEETGYSSSHLEPLITLRTWLAFCDEKIEVFVARDLIPTSQHLDEDEFIDVGAYSVSTLRRMILDHEIEDAKTIAALMSYMVKYE